jgi:hypothetical protein
LTRHRFLLRGTGNNEKETAMAKKRSNSNCLHGMQCPRCNSLEPFAIGITTTMRFYDSGSDDQLDDNEWDP